MNAEPKKAAEQPRPSLRKALKGAPQRLWRLIYHNWPWKLLALFLALCLWAGLITQDPTLTRERVFTDVTVSVVGPDTLRRNSGLIVLSGLEDENLTARLRVDVPQREYNTVTASNYNPLFIYGDSGLGKTHLLNAIGNYALVKDPNLKVRYVTSEEFTNEFIEALADTNQSSGQIKEFNRRYREVDVLLIDDIQFLSGKDATLEQFFHTFNTLHQANKRIVIASDVPPKDLQGFNERLISRFESGLTVDVKPPDLETRIAILRMIATMNGSNIPNDVFNLIAERFTENIRELEGALNRVTAMASLSNQPVTKALAEQTLQDFFTTDVEIKPADIITQVAKYFYLTFDDIVGRSRTKKIALARQIAMYLVRELTSMSLNDIGLVFGGKDHTTVMHAYTRINDEMQEKQEIYNYVTELTLQLKQRSNDK